MYRLIGDNHTLDGLPFAAQVFLRALDGVRRNLAREAGVTGTELRALSRIAEEAEITQAALAEHLDISGAAAVTVIEALYDQGLVLRPSADAPEGEALLELSDQGHVVMEKVYRDFQASINAAADSLDDERRFAFDSGLLKMARKLDGPMVHGRPAGAVQPD